MQSFKAATLIAMLMFSVSAFGQLLFPDGSQQIRAATDFQRVVFVPAEGTPTQNGTNLLSVLSAINDATLSNRYLIQLDIGTYDLGSGTLTTKAFIQIDGLGQNLTSITSSALSTIVMAATDSDLQGLALHNSGNGTSVLTATCIECELLDSRVEHTGVSGGTNTGVMVQAGAELLIQNSSIGLTAANTGGAIRGIEAVGAGATVIMFLSDIETESESSGTTRGLIIGAGAFGEVCTSAIDTTLGDLDLTIQVLAGGECTFGRSEISGTTSLSNSGTTNALLTEFDGTRSGGGVTTYVRCLDGTGILRPILDTNSAVP